MPIDIFTYPENLVKIGRVRSDIIGLQGRLKRKVRPNIGRPTPYSLWARQSSQRHPGRAK